MTMATAARVKSVTGPFDAGKTVEVKLALEWPAEGELYLRVPAESAGRYAVGDAYVVTVGRAPA